MLDVDYKIQTATTEASSKITLGDGLNTSDTLLCYMKDDKFERFIKHGLNLTRADIFTKEDPFEAEYTLGIYQLARCLTSTDTDGNIMHGKGELKDQCDKIRKHAFVGCWTLNPNENVALWKLYGGRGNGVVIKTTIGKLKAELEHFIENLENKKRLKFQLVNKRMIKIDYIDHHDLTNNKEETETKMMSGTGTDVLHFKNIGYKYEDEVRLIFDTYMNVETGMEESIFGESIVLEIRPQFLIDEILISPYACNCYFDAVKEVSKRLTLEKNVIWSKLKYVPS